MIVKHWQEAQDEAHAKSETNSVTAQDVQGRDVVLVGNPVLGWLLMTPEGCMAVPDGKPIQATPDAPSTDVSGR